MLIDSLLSGQKGAFTSACRISSCPRSCLAPSRSRSSRARRARRCWRCSARTMCAPRGPRAVALPRRRAPRAAQRDDPGHHHHRPAGGACCWPAPSSPKRSSPGRASASGWSIRSSPRLSRRAGRPAADRRLVMFVNLRSTCLRPHQSAHPHRGERCDRDRPAVRPAGSPSRTPARHAADFWFSFSENRGAVIGLVFMVCWCWWRCSRRSSRRMTPACNIATRCSCRRSGRSGGAPPTCSAPTRSAATSSRD
jgi:hypothetical protein